ncbi:MAG: Ldh family oxidoreductase [Anaerolineae bacterium]|nr:Ldh family oxidoreductase [Anaerolineae bacterium]MDH7474605.1 Ldh family oxidoreductase [Anaerolineae bacterium]
MTQEIRIPADVLHDVCQKLLEKVGVPADQADLIARVIVRADLRGIGSHGVLRLPAYIHKVQRGLMAAYTQVTLVREKGATALLDGGGGFGQVAGVRGMEEAIRRAEKYGVGSVGVRNANHFGIAAYYAMMALEKGMIGVVISNAAPSMAPWGGVEPLLGSNPVCVAIPTGEEVAVVLDMASTNVARGKIRLAARQGQKIPLGWALDFQGRPTEDPQAALEGTLLPIGGPKGYGIALVNDALAGVLTGSPFGPAIPSLHDLDRRSAVGFFFQALDVAAFAERAEFESRMQQMLTTIRGSARAEGVERIYIPGEIEWEKEREREAHGVPLPEAVLSQLRDLAIELGVAIDL